MALFKKEQIKQKTPVKKIGFYIDAKAKADIRQQFKGEVQKDEIKFPTELGEAHPFDGKITEAMYKGYGLVTGVVDKYIDFIVGPGFFVRSESDQAQTIIEQFNEDVNMDTMLRAWIKEALTKPSGYLELGGKKAETVKGMKILNGNSMYVKRDNKGKIQKYNQFKGDLNKFSRTKIIPFEPFQIAQLKVNSLGDDAYGMGLIQPVIPFINDMIGYEANLTMLMHRKANAPIHVKIGNDETPAIPEAVTSFGSELEWMNNKHEWATDHLVEMKVLDFGKLGDKFDFPLQHALEQFMKGVQIPKVLMGGDVNLAVAPVQMDAFERRIQSIQAEVEKIIETKIYKRVLNSQGIDEHVEFEWGQPSNTEKNERIKQITELLKLPTLVQEMQVQLQLELAKLMNLEVDDIKPEDLQKKEVDETAQPRVPGQNRSQQMIKQTIDTEHILQMQKKIYEEKKEDSCECGTDLGSKTDYTLKEWLDFDFSVYLAFILQSVNEDEFALLAAANREEIKLGKLGKTQISSLKRVLSNGFREGKTILEIAESIKEKVNIKDLKDETGKIKALAENRAFLIARTETTRLSNLGASKHYEAGGVKKYRWVATLGERTSDICRKLNGQVFEVGKGPLPPAHINCRSSIREVLE